MFHFLKPNARKVLANEISKRLMARLEIIKLKPVRILEIHSRIGNFTKQLPKRYKKAEIVKVKDGFQAVANQSIDLVFANLLFFPPEELPQIFIELKRILKPDGLLFFSMLGPDTLYEFHTSLAKYEKIKNPCVDMHDIGDMLTKAKFTDPVMDMEKLTFTYTKKLKLLADLETLLELLYEIKSDHPLLSEANISENLSDSMSATFEIIYGHAWGNIQQIKNGHETLIPLNSIKKMPNP